MKMKSKSFQRSAAGGTRRRALVGTFGLLVLAVLVVAHAVALTVFLWEATARAGGIVAVGLLWAVSAVALFFVARGVRQVVAAFHSASGAGGASSASG
jgi:hypothetical protein